MEFVDRGQGPAVEIVAQPLVDEREPNDDRQSAQPLEPGKGIRGALLSAAGKADEDFYSYLVQEPTAPLDPGPGPRPQELLVQLVPSAGANLQLELSDGEGRRIFVLDEHRGGEVEKRSLVVGLGQRLQFRVRPSSRQKEALAGPAAAYQLLLSQSAAPVGSEIEPNDTRELALAAPPVLVRAAGSGISAELVGQLSSRKDEDWFLLPLFVPPEGAQADGGTADGGVPDGGVPAGTILKVEVLAEGATPALRVVSEAGVSLLDVRGSGAELRLRNAPLLPGAHKVLIAVRAATWKGPDVRYQLHVATEAQLDGAEQEPNDRCEAANALPAAPGGEIAGFLWPGDEDCYRLALPGPSLVTLRLEQADECQAALKLPGDPKPAGREIADLRRSGQLLVRVVGRPQRGCFDVPYRLQVQVAPDPAP